MKRKITIFETKNGVIVATEDDTILNGDGIRKCWSFNELSKAKKLISYLLESWHGKPPTDEEKRLWKL